MAGVSSTVISRLFLGMAASLLAAIGASGFGAHALDDSGAGSGGQAVLGAPLCGEPFDDFCAGADMAPVGGNGTVNVDDLLVVVNHWGVDGAPTGFRPPGDCAPLPGGDCLVNVNDLIAIIRNWGTCPSGACCLPGGQCSSTTFAACTQQGGEFVDGSCFNQSVCPTAMPNDDCAAASATLGTWYNLHATTDGPSGEPGSCESLIVRDLWYRRTIACGGVTEFRASGDGIDKVMAVYDGWKCPPTEGSLLGCLSGTGTIELVLDLESGREVTIRVGTTGKGPSGPCNLSMSCITIANDDCAGATTTLGNWNNHYATTDGPAGEPGNICESMMVRDLWYRATVTCVTLTRFRVSGTSADKVIAVYDGWTCPPAVGALLGCVRGTGNQDIILDLDVGHQVLIRVGTTEESQSTHGILSQSCTSAP